MICSKRYISTALSAATLFLLAGSTVLAQEITGTITGSVRDQSQAFVPGATVTLRNLGTNATKTLTIIGGPGATPSPRGADGRPPRRRPRRPPTA